MPYQNGGGGGFVYLSGGITKLELVSCYCCLTKLTLFFFVNMFFY